MRVVKHTWSDWHAATSIKWSDGFKSIKNSNSSNHLGPPVLSACSRKGKRRKKILSHLETGRCSETGLYCITSMTPRVQCRMMRTDFLLEIQCRLGSLLGSTAAVPTNVPRNEDFNYSWLCCNMIWKLARHPNWIHGETEGRQILSSRLREARFKLFARSRLEGNSRCPSEAASTVFRTSANVHATWRYLENLK